MSDDKAEYQDEIKFVSWLKFQQSVELFEQEVDEQEELDRQDMAVARNATDEAVYSFADAIRQRNLLEADHDYYSQSTVDLSVEVPSQSAWVSTETVRISPKVTVTMEHISDCGKDLKDCYTFSCNHRTVVVGTYSEPDVREEFKTDWNDPADRPDELAFWGLPGLRPINRAGVTVVDTMAIQKHEVTCQECFIITPKADGICFACESVLV